MNQPHEYLSTGCLHGDVVLKDGRTGHEYCQGDTGHAGSKRPAECKFCAAPCTCLCHGLPFRKLSESGFVDFTVDLLRNGLALPIVNHRRGEEPRRLGIDMYMACGDGLFAVRCEHHREFQPGSFDRVLAETAEAEADRFLLLVATGVSDNIKARAAEAGWEIWDANTLTAKVRALDEADAAALVEEHFPGLSASFLRYNASPNTEGK